MSTRISGVLEVEWGYRTTPSSRIGKQVLVYGFALPCCLSSSLIRFAQHFYTIEEGIHATGM